MAQIKYTTATEVKLYPSVPDDANDNFLDMLIARASAYINKQTGRSFGHDNDTNLPTVVTDEVYQVENWGGFYLNHYDVSEITAVTVGPNNTEYLDGDYTFDAVTGRLYIGGYASDPSNNAVKVSYKYGYSGVPDDIKFATEQLVIAMYLGGSTGTGQIVSERTGNYQVSYASPGSASKEAPGVMDIIKQYKIIHI